jgi:hypothetical protein
MSTNHKGTFFRAGGLDQVKLESGAQRGTRRKQRQTLIGEISILFP